jgi:hypothetical protein
LKGTVVSAAHSEQVVRVSGRTLCAPPHTFRLALLAMLGIVLKLFVLEKDLFARSKYEVGAAV